MRCHQTLSLFQFHSINQSLDPAPNMKLGHWQSSLSLQLFHCSALHGIDKQIARPDIRPRWCMAAITCIQSWAVVRGMLTSWRCPQLVDCCSTPLLLHIWDILLLLRPGGGGLTPPLGGRVCCNLGWPIFGLTAAPPEGGTANR